MSEKEKWDAFLDYCLRLTSEAAVEKFDRFEGNKVEEEVE